MHTHACACTVQKERGWIEVSGRVLGLTYTTAKENAKHLQRQAVCLSVRLLYGSTEGFHHMNQFLCSPRDCIAQTKLLEGLVPPEDGVFCAFTWAPSTPVTSRSYKDIVIELVPKLGTLF